MLFLHFFLIYSNFYEYLNRNTFFVQLDTQNFREIRKKEKIDLQN